MFFRMGNIRQHRLIQNRLQQKQQHKQQQRLLQKHLHRQQQHNQTKSQDKRQALQHHQYTIFKIQTTTYLLNIANILRETLYNIGLSAVVMSSEEIARDIERGLPNVHYIFLCIGHVFHLPKSKYYIYNLEQVNYYPDFPLLGLVGDRANFINNAFKNACVIFDYSKMNIVNYPDDFKRKAVYLPVPLIDEKTTVYKKEYDVLFFGGMNVRRQKILKYLNENTDMTIRIVTNVFGEKLNDIIKKSRIVFNIHFKASSLLETSRVHDCMGRSVVISEESIDKETMVDYKEIVKFVPVIKEDLSNMDDIIETIQGSLNNVCNTIAEKNMRKIIKGKSGYFKIYKYPSLFHKYELGLYDPNKPITYELIQTDKTPKKLFAHLHCYDIPKFNEIYSEYIEKICSFFKVVITYSIGENNIKDDRFIIIKIPNKGMDIGAKFCMVQYLNDNSISYEYILFLHSKSDKKTRRKYFEPLIENLSKSFIDNMNHDGYFPDIQWEINGDKLKMITGNPQFARLNLPERNLDNRNDLLNYLACKNRTNRFVEGNVYILSKKIAKRIFGDKKLYNILNRVQDFDYNWVCVRYGLSGSLDKVYNEFIAKKLPPRDEYSYDGYIEHAFERVVLNMCENPKILSIGKFRINRHIEGDIVILAVYPKNLNYIFIINTLLKLHFKKIIIVYSSQDYSITFDSLLNNSRIQMIKTDNIGCDFKKYYIGLMQIKNEKYNRLWLINDSFIMTDAKVFTGDRWRRFLCNDLVGCYYSSEVKKHIQSYFMILSNKMAEYFVNKLTHYKFKSINTDLEVNITNEIINNKNYSYDVLHNTTDTFKGNPILTYGSTSGWIKTNENGVILEKFKLSTKQKFILYVVGCTEFIETHDFFNMKKNRNPHIKGTPLRFFKNKWNILSVCHDLIPNYIDRYPIAFNVLRFLKHYRGGDEMLKILQKTLFEFNKPVKKITKESDLKKMLKKNQAQTKKRKLVYTCNIGGYDTFHDIENKNVEDDVDYIYISNRKDECCCKNFIHIFCNLNEPDNFKFNRKIKFDKTLFDCYEKVCYVDANVKIHCKLGRFWDTLDADTDLVLFSHPYRNTVREELATLTRARGNHKKWGFNQNRVSSLSEKHKANLNNDLFWLNVQLSTTKRNIYEDIEENYKKYKLKRDQVYFSLFSNKFNIIKIDIKSYMVPPNNSVFFRDGGYGTLLGWSDKFSRPLGGSHL